MSHPGNYDPHASDPDDDQLIDWATVGMDVLQCARCGKWDDTVFQSDMLCDDCYTWNRRHPDVPLMRPSKDRW